MKKSIIFALLLSLLSVQQIHAQKWLKKLGKVAENVLANDQKTTNKASGSIPGCTVKYTSCVANGNDVHINLLYSVQLPVNDAIQIHIFRLMSPIPPAISLLDLRKVL